MAPNDPKLTPELTKLQHPASYPYQRQSYYRKFVQAALLLLVIVVFYSVDFKAFLPNPIEPQDQIPSLHFSTPTNIHGAPFGLFVDDDKTWHIYFPTTPPRGRKTGCGSWGHAISSDLYTWSIQPLAFQGDDGSICGGSVVIDRNNTSGLFPHQSNGVIALYTQHHSAAGKLQLSIAYSMDGGYVFKKHPRRTSIHLSDGSQELVDPKVIWHEVTQRWVMTAAKATGTSVGIYTSPDLFRWQIVSEFSHPELHGYRYPNLSPIPRVSSTGAENPNWPTVPGGVVEYTGNYILVSSFTSDSPLNKGSITRYFPGEFNGSHFQPIDSRTDRFIDFGPDNYASQFFFGLPEGAPVVILGLAANLRERQCLSAADHASAQISTLTIPREGHLIHGPNEGDLSYFSRPVGLEILRDGTLASLSAQNLSDFKIVFNSPQAVLIEASFDMQPADDEVVELNVDFILTSSSKSDKKIFCSIVFKTWTADFGCDRSEAASTKVLDDSDSSLDQMVIHEVRPLLPFHNPAIRRWKIQLIIDQSILEVFLNNGVAVGTTKTFAESSIDTIKFQGSTMPTWADLSIDVQKLRPRTERF